MYVMLRNFLKKKKKGVNICTQHQWMRCQIDTDAFILSCLCTGPVWGMLADQMLLTAKLVSTENLAFACLPQTASPERDAAGEAGLAAAPGGTQHIAAASTARLNCGGSK